ncbi:MAG: ATP-binding protein [Actinotalea sp.]|nr:ATP-binding protein [Actinotalea sp.]
MFLGPERTDPLLLPELDGTVEAPGTELVVARLQVDGAALADVRAWLRVVVADHGWPPPTERTLLLLTTELVANAQNHGPEGGRVALTLGCVGDLLRVAVDDDGAAPPVVRRPAPEALDGRGMLLVDRMAQAWGSDRRPDGGKTVWFTLPVGSP